MNYILFVLLIVVATILFVDISIELISEVIKVFMQVY